MKKVLILGSTGLIGHQIYFYLESREKYQLYNIANTRKINSETININALNESILSKTIHEINPDILIIGLGCPKQEIIADFFYKIEKKIFIIPVGAALNFVSGYEKRAPKLFRLMEIEFIWRFFQSPNMIFKRVCNSLFNIFLKKHF